MYWTLALYQYNLYGLIADETLIIDGTLRVSPLAMGPPALPIPGLPVFMVSQSLSTPALS
jgi:hypothetical protein